MLYQYPRLIEGPGSLSQLPSFVEGRILIVTDQGIVSAGHLKRVTDLLDQAGHEIFVYDQVRENPNESEVETCTKFAHNINPDVVIGLGGGSALMADYQGYGHAKGPLLPFIAIPTTAGTGSECQSYAIISNDFSNEKMACGDLQALARIAILDPELTASMPLMVARLSALDALSHALESAVCTKRSKESVAFSTIAFEKISGVIENIIRGDASVAQRGEMLSGAAMAGRAIEGSMLGAAHATANPLTAYHGVAHGHAVITMLPTIMRWNAEVPEAHSLYQIFANQIGRDVPGLISWIEELTAASELQKVDIPAEKIGALAKSADEQWTGNFNPRSLSLDDFKAVYAQALLS